MDRLCHPTQRARSCTVAISQLTEKRKDGRLCHLLAAKKLPEFHCNLPQTACGWLNLYARHNFSKP
jgi:hypothetical protein